MNKITKSIKVLYEKVMFYNTRMNKIGIVIGFCLAFVMIKYAEPILVKYFGSLFFVAGMLILVPVVIIILIVLQIIWKLIFMNTILVCPHCKYENRGDVSYCKKCLRRVDIDRVWKDEIIRRCPNCYRINKQNEDECEVCNYNFMEHLNNFKK